MVSSVYDFATLEAILTQIIDRYDMDELRRMALAESQLVHYTSAANSLNVINFGTLWMRNARLMNDFSEVDYGKWCVDGALDRLKSYWNQVLDAIHSGLADRTLFLYKNLENHRISNTYILSLSEHLKSEDDLGRLSMWRAYGGDAGGVALVFDRGAVQQDSKGLNIYASVVRYTNQDGFVSVLATMLRQLAAEQAALQHMDPEHLASRLAGVLHFAVLSTKHPAFAEEREIRLLSGMEPSEIVSAEVETVGGVPQIVWKIPLRNDPSRNYKAALPDILRRVIVGPVPVPPLVNEAIQKCLEKALVPNPATVVHTSWVPLRKSL